MKGGPATSTRSSSHFCVPRWAILSLLLPLLLLMASKMVVVSAARKENVLYLDVAGGANGEISRGRIVIELLPELAPLHVERIRLLARGGFYDGVVWHRVIDGFVAQTGDPIGQGFGGTGVNLRPEFSTHPHTTGVVNMARADPLDSADTQFSIMLEPQPHLDGHYTVWGRVLGGMETVRTIKKGNGPDGRPSEPLDSILRFRSPADVKIATKKEEGDAKEKMGKKEQDDDKIEHQSSSSNNNSSSSNNNIGSSGSSGSSGNKGKDSDDDLYFECGFWSHVGECEANSVWMRENCPLSCGFALINLEPEALCANFYRDCNEWATPGEFSPEGECVNNAMWMLQNCRRSCDPICTAKDIVLLPGEASPGARFLTAVSMTTTTMVSSLPFSSFFSSPPPLSVPSSTPSAQTTLATNGTDMPESTMVQATIDTTTSVKTHTILPATMLTNSSTSFFATAPSTTWTNIATKHQFNDTNTKEESDMMLSNLSSSSSPTPSTQPERPYICSKSRVVRPRKHPKLGELCKCKIRRCSKCLSTSSVLQADKCLRCGHKRVLVGNRCRKECPKGHIVTKGTCSSL